ncbi:MAG: hypothetical protein MMC33_000292 [Icmadophila ericetorum]|nr:hypothetical protein [Icmadophila ericetorum]
MSTFTVPLSSSPPSTPGKGSNSGKFNFSTHPSTTPAGPPPSSVFGSSAFGAGNALFQSKPRSAFDTGSLAHTSSPSFKPLPPRKDATFKPTESLFSNGAFSNTFALPSSSPQGSLREDGVKSSRKNVDEVLDRMEEDQEYSGNDELSAEDEMDFDSGSENRKFSEPHPKRPRSSYEWRQEGSLFDKSLPRSERNRQSFATSSIRSKPQSEMRFTRRRNPEVHAAAMDLAREIGSAELTERDDLIVRTEDLIDSLQTAEHSEQEQQIKDALVVVPEALSRLWQSCCNKIKADISTEDVEISIGPRAEDPPLKKAEFLASLLLQLHHPPATKGGHAFAASRPYRSSLRSTTKEPKQRLKTVPEVLFDWLATHHNPVGSTAMTIQSYHPNAATHPNFWEFIHNATLRGQLLDVQRTLKEANFEYARTAKEDGSSRDGYYGLQLENVRIVIRDAIRVLENCPATDHGDWNIVGSDWTAYRKQIQQAISSLAAFAEGRDRDLDPKQATFQAEHFGIKSTSNTLSQSARRAGSKVPWTVYQNLKTMYRILLGGQTEILSIAIDWVEATVGLTVWWDGHDDDGIPVGSSAMTRVSLRLSQAKSLSSGSQSMIGAYLGRLSTALERATEDTESDKESINFSNAVEVGLAAVFQGDVEAVLGLLKAWSMPIAAAVVEVADLAGWYEAGPPGNPEPNFDASDLMVLSYAQPQPQLNLSKDGLLMEYAEKLFEKESLQVPNSNMKEGWELSMRIFGRFLDSELANKRVEELLDKLPLISNQRADRAMTACRSLGLSQKALDVAERYADFIAETTGVYGAALVYYARAHSRDKLRDVLDLLISTSLVQSLAYPPKKDLNSDQHLRDLLFNPGKALGTLAQFDEEAAILLQQCLSGYATLRKFYDLRDEEMHLESGQKPSMRPLARKKAAASALLAVIASATDNIHGGLYDEERTAVVAVDGLLSLLGEALIFVNPNDENGPFLTLPQILSLLKAIEDLQTCIPKIYLQCEDCFHATLSALSGFQNSQTPRDLLKKSISSLTASSGFSLIGSSMMLSQSQESLGHSQQSQGHMSLRSSDQSTNGENQSQVLKTDGEKRGWDWRLGMRKGAKGSDVLRILRLRLAEEVGRVWVRGGDGEI